MEEQQAPSAPRRPRFKIFLRILRKVFVWLLLLIVAIFLLILTPPVQNFITGKATRFLEEKLGTKVEIDRLFITLNGRVAVDGLYLEDQQGDTLLFSNSLRVSLDLYKIIFKGNVDIGSVELDGLTANVVRPSPDSAFNYQYIIDAFDSGPSDDTSSSSGSSSGFKMGLVSISHVNLRYADALTGDDYRAAWESFSTDLGKMDFDNGNYAIGGTHLRGLRARIERKTPVAPQVVQVLTDSVVATDTIQGVPMLLALQQLRLEDADIIYDDSATMTKMHVTAASLLLDDLEVAPDEMRYQAAGLAIKKTLFTLDNNNEPPQKQGIDFAHLNTEISNLDVRRFFMKGDSLSGTLQSLALTEKSGLDVKQLSAGFIYGPRQASLSNLELRTGNSTVSRNIELSYDSIGQLSENFDAVYANIDLQDTRIQNRDILFFVPDLRQQPIFANPADYWTLDARLNGTMKELQIEQLQLTGPENLRASLAGSLRGVTDPDNLQADLSIAEIYVTRNAVHSFVPPAQMPASIQVPGWVKTTGSIKGNAKQARMAMRIATDQGLVDINGDIRDAGNPDAMQYAMQLETRSLNLGYILKDTSMYGPLTASFTANGRGTDIKKMQATLDGKLESMRLNGYTYTNMPVTASVQNQVAELSTGLQDPNLHFSLNGTMDLRKEFPSLQIDAQIDSAKLQPTNWTSEPWIIRTGIQADFANVDPDNLDGQLLLNQLLAVREDERLQLDTVRLVAGVNDTARYLRLESDIATVDMNGRYRLTQIPAVIQQLVQPHYSIGTNAAAPDPYNFRLNATINDRPMLRSLVPGLEAARGVLLTSHFSNEEGMDVVLKADLLSVGGNEINGLVMSAKTTDSALLADVRLSALKAGAMQLDSTIVTARLADNTIDFDAILKDRAAKDRYLLGGIVRQDAGDMVIQMNPEQLLLNYEQWQMSDSNSIRIGSDGIWARNFELTKGEQRLSLNSKGEAGNSPLHVSLKDFHASTLTDIVLSDSTMIDGRLTGEIDLENLNSNPVFAGEIMMNDLSFKQDTIGNLSATFTNAGGGNAIRADMELTGHGNDVNIEGMYKAADASLDLTVDLKKLPMQTVEAFSGGAVRNTSGYLNGPFRITGPVSGPVVKGELRFNNALMNVSMLNSVFGINNEKLEFTGEGLRLNQFQVKDSSGNELVLDGQIKTTNYINYNFDLDIRARNFQALSSTKRDNKLFWGQLFFNTNLELKGTEAKPVLDGRLTINDKTKMTVVLPQSEPGVVERDGVIEFVDMDAPLNDSLFLAAYDSMNVSGITGMDVSLNVTIDKGADFTLVIDEGNGDFLNVQGEAQLSTGIDPSGKITMVGTYELEQGAYELSFNMLRKKFDIQKGSKIVWEGEPTSANVDITARYTANTAPLDLVKGQLDENTSREERNMYLQRLPFDVNLRMQGELMRPQITFDIVLPTNRNYGVASDIVTNVRAKLEQLRQSPGDMNKQVFSLLLLNRFVAENPFNSAGAPSASTMVRQSVSKLLTEQLNRLAEGLIDGVDINLGIEASDDYTTGTRQDRTDLNVGLSKRLMNDRLTVSVGSNFNLDGPQDNAAQANNIAGNVAIDYALSSDGRYKVRAYRKNDYQGVIDGFVVETGVSFIITLDFNEFKQIFRKRRRPGGQPDRREGPQDAAPARDSTGTGQKGKASTNPVPNAPQAEGSKEPETSTNQPPAEGRIKEEE